MPDSAESRIVLATPPIVRSKLTQPEQHWIHGVAMAHDHQRNASAPSYGVSAAQGPGRANVDHDHSMWWMAACCAPTVVAVLALLAEFLASR